MDTQQNDAQTFTIDQGTFYASPSQDNKMFYNLSRLHKFYDADFAATIGKYLNPDSVVADVGANIGEFSVGIAKYTKKIYAFEPVARSRALLEKNTAACPNVEIVPVALGNKEGEVSMTPDTANNSGTYRVTGQGSIPLRTLDSFAIEPNFIKIDVQGLEIRALQGGQRTIAKSRPTILFEISDLTVGYGGIFSLPKILPRYTLRYFPSLKKVSLVALIAELIVRYYLKRPRHYDILAIPR
jgi:FkbM family methyltransferase